MQEKQFLFILVMSSLLFAPTSRAVKGEDSRTQVGNVKVDIFADTQWEQESPSSLVLQQGVIRLRAESQESLRVSTPVGTINVQGILYDDDTAKSQESALKENSGRTESEKLCLDVIVRYDAEKATAQVEVFMGTALVQGTFREEILNVQKNERGFFVGVPEVDGPAFDILLKGRKSVRGALRGPETLSAATQEELRKKYEPKLRPPPKKVVIRAKPGQICSAPFAKYNDCLWRCRTAGGLNARCGVAGGGGECVREKCLANGQWGDRTVLKGTAARACEKGKEQVAVCDY